LYSDFMLDETNIVILARNYNPSIVSKEWLYNKNIIIEEAMNFVHTPVFSLVETEHISFILNDDRLQISLKRISPENIEGLPKIACKFVSALPETPYSAVGFNYRYHIPQVSFQMEVLFSPNDIKLKELFAEDYKLGGVVLFKFKDFVVRMNATPVRGENARIAIDFNFHCDCHNAEEVKERIELYSDITDRTKDILNNLSK